MNGEIMDFPNTFDEFAESYGFYDKAEVYCSSNTMLIPVFRVKQWLEHEDRPTEEVLEDIEADCISRNAIIKTLNKMDRYVADELTLCDTGRKFPQNEVFIVDDVYEEIAEQLPSVQPKQRWIPVSERLPENHKDVLICLSSDEICIGCYNSHKLPFSNNAIGWGASHVHNWCSNDVIAWMPLPEPYKASPTGAKFEEVKNEW